MLGAYNTIHAQSCHVSLKLRHLLSFVYYCLSGMRPELMRVSQELHAAPTPRPHRSKQLLAEEEGSGSTLRRNWRLEQASICDTTIVERHRQCVVLHIDRQGGIESHGANYELSRVHVHRVGRVVGREEGHQSRYVV